MKKWYLWLIMSLIFAVAGVINFLNGDNIVGQVIQVSITVALAIIQFFVDRKKSKGTQA